MANWCIDFASGDDSNTGAYDPSGDPSNWTQALKTISGLTSGKGLAAGDTVYCAETPAPTSLGINASWNDNSKTVTLASALNANIDLCELAWTASANVTATASTTRKEGSYSASLAIASGFTTGLAAYKTISDTDFSGYEQISFWIRNSAAIASSGVLQIKLCSDTAGVTAVDTFDIPAIPSTNCWIPVTVNKGSALGASIQSVALYAASDPGTITVLLDNIIACKAVGNDALSLTSMIGKNATGTEFYPIQSINGTTVLIDNYNASLASEGRGYSGTSETVETYKIEPVGIAMQSSATATVNAFQISGTDGNPITYKFGVNTTTGAQTGYTYLSGVNGNGYGLSLNGKSYIEITDKRLCLVKFNYGFISGTNTSNLPSILKFGGLIGCGYGFYNTNGSNLAIEIDNALNNAQNFNLLNNNNTVVIGKSNNNQSNIAGVNILGFFNHVTVTSANNNAGGGIECDESNENVIYATDANNNTGYGILFSSLASNNRVIGCSTSGNSTAGVYMPNGQNYLVDCTIGEATEVAGATDYANSMLHSQNHDGTTGNHVVFTDGGRVQSDTTTRDVASGISWKISPTSTNRSATYPLKVPIAKIFVEASKEVTASFRMYRDNLGITGTLHIPEDSFRGIAADVEESVSSVSAWETVTLTFTPTVSTEDSAPLTIYALVYGGTSYNVYVDTFSCTQA